jgi:HAD superfamily hydrolase (TIGR01509 family)
MKKNTGMKPKIKALVFDLGGVITHGGYLDFVHHYVGRNLSPAAKKRIEQLEHQVNLATISEAEFYGKVQKEFKVHLTPKQMHNYIVKHMQTNKALIKYIPHLKKAKVALFTNSIGHISTEMLKLRHLEGKRIFDKVFLSNIMHLAKPSQSSYHFVISHLKVKPSEALMVDDRKENIDAAKKAGMQGIAFKNVGQFKKELKKYQLGN